MEAVRLGSMARSPSSEKLHALGSGPAAASWRRPAPAPSQHATHDIHASASVAASPFSGGGAAGSGSGSNGGGAGGRLGMSVSRSLRRSLSFGEWRRPLPWLRVPDELWGAVNALSAAANPSTEKPPRGARLSTQASAPSPAQTAPPEEDLPSPSSPLRQRLDFRARLSNRQTALCAFTAAVVCVLAYVLRHPARLSPLYGAGMGALFAAALLLTRLALLEREFTKRLVGEADLAGAQSRFRPLEGVKVHYTVEAPSQRSANGKTPGRPRGGVAAAHCYHGFGANTFSWSFVQAALAAKLQTTVTAHDMPGFGLTERVKQSSAYTLECNGRLGRAVMEAELQGESGNAASGNGNTGGASNRACADGGGDAAKGSGSSSSVHGGGSAAAGGRVLIGHSLGGACAAAEVINNPEDIAALVLVAPAIVALRLGRHAAQEAAAEEEALEQGDEVGAARARASFAEFRSNTASTLMQNIGSLRSTTLRVAAACGYALVSSGTRLALLAATPVLVLALRGSVRSRAFWERGLARAWHRKGGVTEAVVDNYRLPQLVRGWEAGLLAFLRARVTAGRSFGARLAAAYHGREAMTQVEQLLDAIVAHDIQVLIVHGENDALVPAANSRRLAAMLPGARLEVLPACGHNPQEELPDKFVELVAGFLNGMETKHG